MTIRRMSVACYKYTLRMCNTYFFSSATVVAQTRLIVSLYAHCLSCEISVNHYQASTAKYLHTTTRVWLLFELAQYANSFHVQNQYSRLYSHWTCRPTGWYFCFFVNELQPRPFCYNQASLKIEYTDTRTDRLHWTVFSSASSVLIVNQKVSLLIE